MWHHNVSFMQKKKNRPRFSGNKTQQHMIRVKHLQMKRWMNLWFGLTAFFFFFFCLEVKCGGGKRNLSRNSQYWTMVIRAQATEQPAPVTSSIFRTPKGCTCHRTTRRNRTAMCSKKSFSRKISGSSDFLVCEKHWPQSRISKIKH